MLCAFNAGNNNNNNIQPPCKCSIITSFTTFFDLLIEHHTPAIIIIIISFFFLFFIGCTSTYVYIHFQFSTIRFILLYIIVVSSLKLIGIIHVQHVTTCPFPRKFAMISFKILFSCCNALIVV